MPGEMRHRGKHRHGRGFGHVFADMGDGGFDRGGFRTGRKLASDDLQLLLLALIAEKPSHGYDLIKLLEERSGGYYVPSPGMIYPALTYLEEAGHATIEQEGRRSSTNQRARQSPSRRRTAQRPTSSWPSSTGSPAR